MMKIKRLTAFQKDIIRLANENNIVTPEIISKHYDESYWTIKMNLYKLEKIGILRRTKETRLEFMTLSSDGLESLTNQ